MAEFINVDISNAITLIPDITIITIKACNMVTNNFTTANAWNVESTYEPRCWYSNIDQFRNCNMVSWKEVEASKP